MDRRGLIRQTVTAVAGFAVGSAVGYLAPRQETLTTPTQTTITRFLTYTQTL